MVLARTTSTHGKQLPNPIHVYDRLWVPHGLVRYGVAPDHPEVKNVQVGPQTSPGPAIPHALPISLSSLKSHYIHHLFSTGCAVPTLHPFLPPSDHYTHPSRPTPPPLHETEHVSIIGQGNVALDIACMLLTPPAALVKYDDPAPVLNVSIITRRGPLQAAFTTKEPYELTTLNTRSMLPLAPELLGSPTHDAKFTRQQSRLLQLLQQQPLFARLLPLAHDPSHHPCRHRDQLALTLSHTVLDAFTRVASSGVTSVQHTDLVVTTLGPHADPAAAYVGPALDHLRTGRGVWVPDGASTRPDHHFDDGDAREAPTAEYSEDALIADDPIDLESVPRVVRYDQWKKIDAKEVRRSAEKDNECERMGWEEAHEFLMSTGAWQSWQ
ncbi:FAD/NAD-P-binding domain-containing protein [Lactarius psammicola]|nr:FAD/NAD-P-binding domain-containing protein [Lactarius psammicola]